MKFGGRVVTDVVLLDVEVNVETPTGRRRTGLGSMPLGNAWSWPSNVVASDQTLAAMEALGERFVAEANACRLVGHPLALTRELAEGHAAAADEVVRTAKLAEPMPRLAQLVAASPLEAALHDAFGKVHDQNAYNLLGREWVNADLGHYLSSDFAGQYLDHYTLRQPKPRMPLYHLVGALDPLTPAEARQRVNDGLPETLGEWIVADGLTHLKIKLAGDDLGWDVERVVAVEAAAAGAGAARLSAIGTIRSTSTRSARTSSTCSIFWQRSRRDRRRHFGACNISSSRRIATCRRIPKTACTARPRSSRW